MPNYIKPHFVILINNDERMQFEATLLVSSLETLGGIKEYYCTIVVPEGFKSSSEFKKFIEKRGEIKTYKEAVGSKPYLYSPRWEVEPKSEIFVPIDSDIIVLKNIEQLFLAPSEKIKGVIGLESPFLNGLNKTVWEHIFKLFKIETEEKRWTKYRVFDKKSIHYLKLFDKESLVDESTSCPFYFNHGLLITSKSIAKKINSIKNDITNDLIKMGFEKSYWLNQIVTTICIEKEKIDCEEIDDKFNSIKKLTEDTHLYHYCSSINKFESIKDIKKDNVAIEKQLDIIYENILCGT